MSKNNTCPNCGRECSAVIACQHCGHNAPLTPSPWRRPLSPLEWFLIGMLATLFVICILLEIEYIYLLNRL